MKVGICFVMYVLKWTPLKPKLKGNNELF